MRPVGQPQCIPASSLLQGSDAIGTTRPPAEGGPLSLPLPASTAASHVIGPDPHYSAIVADTEPLEIGTAGGGSVPLGHSAVGRTRLYQKRSNETSTTTFDLLAQMERRLPKERLPSVKSEAKHHGGGSSQGSHLLPERSSSAHLPPSLDAELFECSYLPSPRSNPSPRRVRLSLPTPAGTRLSTPPMSERP